jgi:hypothetical protein
MIFLAAKGKSPKRQWILDADLAAAFDRIPSLSTSLETPRPVGITD